MRFLMCLVVFAFMALSLTSATPAESLAIQQHSLFDVDVQGHANFGDRLVRKHGGHHGGRGGNRRKYYRG
uniref:Uncharacterized protein n=1 Tax=Stomoxys calcitrans TaxID=35570 RepID=A0A1I8QCZ1_STOCA|nr:unnamed protein product [Stomoxys calcitrans]